MTETQWLECNDAGPMLEFLRGKVSDRKLRLFVVACCRRIWPLLTDERSRRAVEVAERYAEGFATQAELTQACDFARDACDEEGGDTNHENAVFHAACAAMSASYPPYGDFYMGADDCLDAALHAVAYDAIPTHATDEHRTAALAAEAAAQAVLLRDIFLDPFRPPPAIDAAVLAWNERAVVRLARDIYEANAWDRLPELGQLLEQAGCTDQDILGHCRELRQVHVRGCFVVDAVLAKS